MCNRTQNDANWELIALFLTNQIAGNTIDFKMNVIKRVKPFVPTETLQDLCNAIVQPYFDYWCALWDNCGKVFIENLQKYQSRWMHVENECRFQE